MKLDAEPKRRRRRSVDIVGEVIAAKLHLDALKKRAIPDLLRQREVIDALLLELGHNVVDVDAIVVEATPITDGSTPTEDGAADGEKRVPIAARRLTPALLAEMGLRLGKKKAPFTSPGRAKRVGNYSGAKTYSQSIICMQCGKRGHDRRSHIGENKKKGLVNLPRVRSRSKSKAPERSEK